MSFWSDLAKKIEEGIAKGLLPEESLILATPIAGSQATSDLGNLIMGPIHAGEQAVKDIGEIAPAVILGVTFLTNPQNWLRVAEAIAGALLVLIGILILFHNSKTGAAVESKVKTGATVAALA